MLIQKKTLPKFRLTLSSEETHEEIHRLTITKLGFYGILLLGLSTIIGLVLCLLLFTPLRKSIPGYPDPHFRHDAIYNAIKIDSLESELIRWEVYSNNLLRVLSGEGGVDASALLSHVGANDSSNEEYLRLRDSMLRARVLKEEQYSLSLGEKRDLPIEGIHFFSPLKGVISNGFSKVSHPAVDITAPAGSVVKAAMDGTVIFAGWSDEFGYTITIQHDSDIVTSYKHNNKLLRKTGDKIKAGTPIAYVGNTGNLTTGDHLHFEIWYKGEPVDPAEYISF